MATLSQLDLAATIERLNTAQKIIVTTHARADGDAIGSAAALTRILRQCGKNCVGYLHEPVAERYAFLTQIEPLATWESVEPAAVIGGAELFVLVDTCARAQLGTVAEAVEQARVRKLAIDHHQTRDDVVDEAFFDPSAAACAQIITHLCDRAGWALDDGAATLLYVGLATDTGWFRFANADRSALETAARLLGRDVRPDVLYERLYLNKSAARSRLTGAVLSSFELHADDRLAVAVLTRETFTRCGATHEMTEDLINELQAIGSVIASVLAVEPPKEGPVRVSFRSKRDIDVAAVAARFGGGGHTRAAGARITGPTETVTRRVIAAMVEAIEKHS